MAFHEATRGQVAQLLGGDLRVEGPVELLQRLLLLEARAMQPLGEHLRLPPVDLVVEQQSEELDVAEPLILGLGAPHLQGKQHPAQLEGLQFGLELGRLHDGVPSSSSCSPWRKALALLVCGCSSSISWSRARMLRTVRRLPSATSARWQAASSMVAA